MAETTPSASPAPDRLPIRISVRLQGDSALIKTLLTHPMYNGLTKDREGQVIAAHHLTDISVRINGEIVVSQQVGPGISVNPLFAWRIAGVKVGDNVEISWRDNRGGENRQQHRVQ